MRAKLTPEEKRQRVRGYARVAFEKLKSDPERYEAKKKKAAEYQRARRSTPEGLEACRLANRRYREANRERVLQKQREYNARRWSDPAWRAQENAKRRQQLKEIKESDAAKLAQVRAAHAARQRRSRANASPERIKAKNEYIKAWKRANPHYQQREKARRRAKPRVKASPERLKAKNEYIKAWKRANPRCRQRERARQRAKREAQKLMMNA